MRELLPHHPRTIADRTATSNTRCPNLAEPYGGIPNARSGAKRAGGKDEASPPGRELAFFADLRNYRR